MAEIIIPTGQEISECAAIYVEALLQDPWYEDNDHDEVVLYLTAFSGREGYFIYALVEKGIFIGVCVGEVVPCIGSPFMRIEDFCVAPGFTSQGFGTDFLDKVQEKALEKGCNCILLTTVKGYPSHLFYEKNGFKELENSVYLYKELNE